MTSTAPWLSYSSSDWLTYAKSLPIQTGKQQRFRTFCLRCAAALHFRKDVRLMLWSPGSVLVLKEQPIAKAGDVFIMRGAANPSAFSWSGTPWTRGLRWIGQGSAATVVSRRRCHPYDPHSLIWLGHQTASSPMRGEFLLAQLKLESLLSQPSDFTWMHALHQLTRSYWSVLIQGYHVSERDGEIYFRHRQEEVRA